MVRQPIKLPRMVGFWWALVAVPVVFLMFPLLANSASPSSAPTPVSASKAPSSKVIVISPESVEFSSDGKMTVKFKSADAKSILSTWGLDPDTLNSLENHEVASPKYTKGPAGWEISKTDPVTGATTTLFVRLPGEPNIKPVPVEMPSPCDISFSGYQQPPDCSLFNPPVPPSHSNSTKRPPSPSSVKPSSRQ
jgi:hypothetical protein